MSQQDIVGASFDDGEGVEDGEDDGEGVHGRW